MAAAVSFGMHFAAATPAGYELPAAAVETARHRAAGTGGSVETVLAPEQAATGADVIYTDVWTSMGQEAEVQARLEAFRGYTVDERLVAVAAPRAVVLHCLPAHYGEEIAESVLYGPRSAVWDQAENRLHAQKALLALVVR
jgi:ornithine carbamoyltransferase